MRASIWGTPESGLEANLAKIVQDAIEYFLEGPVDVMPPSYPFEGGGVYALYYQGSFGLYKGLSLSEVTEKSVPIYVGKAVPPGWRTARINISTGRQLYNRIREHYRNIVVAKNLKPEEFKCRYMVLDEDESGIIGPVEAGLIRKFEPLWNTVIDGFGNHTPGAGRFDQARSGWDVLHPGRTWAERCRGQAPEYKDLVAKIEAYTNRIKRK
jgi:hypothetical protein